VRRGAVLERAVAALRQTEDVPDQLLAHLSPLGWEHVNLTGDYIWSAERPVTEGRDGFHPLRAALSPDRALLPICRRVAGRRSQGYGPGQKTEAVGPRRRHLFHPGRLDDAER
jgi:hypothetical protein